MEYTFRKNGFENPKTFYLYEYEMVIKSAGKAEKLPYSNIKSLRLTRSGRKYYTIINTIDNTEIIIGNYNKGPDHVIEECSSKYISFVRILHYHLSEKSKAKLYKGTHIKSLLLSSVIAIFAAIALSFGIISLNINPLNSAGFLTIVLTLLFLLVSVIVNWECIPGKYSPENIPCEFLPVQPIYEV